MAPLFSIRFLPTTPLELFARPFGNCALADINKSRGVSAPLAHTITALAFCRGVFLSLSKYAAPPARPPPLFFMNADGGHQRAALRAHFAAKTQAETTIHACASARARLRQYRHGRGKRIPAQFLRGTFEYYTRRFHRERR